MTEVAEEQQPLIITTDNSTSGVNYDSINYSAINDNGEVPNEDVIDNEEGCTTPQASFNMINLLGKYYFLYIMILKLYILFIKN